MLMRASTTRFSSIGKLLPITIEAYMLTEAYAQQRSAFALERYASIPRRIEIQLHGKEYYGVQIYDMLQVELSIPGRTYIGTWKAQVISLTQTLRV